MLALPVAKRADLVGISPHKRFNAPQAEHVFSLGLGNRIPRNAMSYGALKIQSLGHLLLIEMSPTFRRYLAGTACKTLDPCLSQTSQT